MRIIKSKILLCAAILVIGGIYYYVKLPALNVHSPGFWGFIIVLALIACGLTALSGVHLGHNEFSFHVEGVRKKILRVFLVLTVSLVLFYIGGSLLSSPIINAGRYHNLLNISDANFTDDIKQISYNEIPLLDKDSAQIIGNRKMGTMIEYVSQFEVSNDYTQINYKNKPVRVTPLRYGSLLKWFTNQSDGIPAYIRIDMATQDAQCVKLSQGMKYTEADHFNRNIYRHLRFSYPTYMFDTLNFEIDDDGNPVYICPVKDFTIGLFGGQTISNVVIVNAATGEMTDYPIDQVPEWVDRVYSSDLLISYYDYYGMLKHGYWNSVLSQKDCLKATSGYNYVALNNDVWVYTGVTSAGDDQSNVGFILMNQRTGETKYYSVTGAEEYSAMNSAEGKVQHLKYKATFPLLLNIAGQPTYFICLKDSAGLVKQYAMVNIEKYTIVSIGNTVPECEREYIKMLKENTELVNSEEKGEMPMAQGKITSITQGVIDGNSHFYLMLENDDNIYDVALADHIDILRYQTGDKISLSYNEEEGSKTVMEIRAETE